MVGPIVGQIIFNQLKFEKTFYCFSAIMIPFLIFAIIWIPNKMNHSDNQRTMSRVSVRSIERIPEFEDRVTISISYFRILDNLRVLTSLIAAVVILIMTLFFEGILSNHLISIHVPADLVGKIFTLRD